MFIVGCFTLNLINPGILTELPNKLSFLSFIAWQPFGDDETPGNYPFNIFENDSNTMSRFNNGLS